MEQQPTQTPFRRSPFEILGECFTIYGRHFRKFILIALIIQIPLAILEFAISDRLPSVEDFQALQVSFAGDPRANLPASAEYSLTEQSELAEALSIDEIVGLMTPLTIYIIATFLLQTFMAGVVAYAVGMQYVTGSIDVGRSYGRAWWRVLTLVVLGVLFFAMILLLIVVVMLLVLLPIVGFARLIVPGLVVLTLAIFWSVAAQAAVIEGYKPIAALWRSFRLVRGNWWRTFAVWMLIVLVAFGLGIVLGLLAIPIALIDEPGGILGRAANAIVGLLGSAVVAPISAIAGALIYLNLRGRKEDYDLNALSEQVGIAPPGDGGLTR